MSEDLEFKPPKGAKTVEDLTDLRDLAAIQAMSGILTGSTEPMLMVNPETVADHAYRYADAMLKARGQK
jgi:hypothetical protein